MVIVDTWLKSDHWVLTTQPELTCVHRHFCWIQRKRSQEPITTPVTLTWLWMVSIHHIHHFQWNVVLAISPTTMCRILYNGGVEMTHQFNPSLPAQPWQFILISLVLKLHISVILPYVKNQSFPLHLHLSTICNYQATVTLTASSPSSNWW